MSLFILQSVQKFRKTVGDALKSKGVGTEVETQPNSINLVSVEEVTCQKKKKNSHKTEEGEMQKEERAVQVQGSVRRMQAKDGKSEE